MKYQFKAPKVGSVVTVTTDWTDYLKSFDQSAVRIRTYSGKVVPNAKHHDPESFCITTGDSVFPIRNIHLDRVTGIVFEDGSVANKTEKRVVETQTWQVKSDSRKGGFYTVVNDRGHFSCTCVGFGFRKSCRHILSVKKSAA